VNIVLLKEQDFVGESRARLTGRAYEHISKVLGSSLGDVLKIGKLNGPLGKGTVVSLEQGFLELDCTFERVPPVLPGVILLIALPRPQTLKKILLEATSLGVQRFIFVKATRTDNSYLQTKVLRDENYREYLHLGLEQSVDTLEPALTVHRQFRRLLEDELSSLIPEETLRFVADPEGGTAIHELRPQNRPVLLAIGPEGGWIPFEREMFESEGFQMVSLGSRILRVETATVGLLSQVKVLREIPL
jgi:RsmE family RNA methyltransferase